MKLKVSIIVSAILLLAVAGWAQEPAARKLYTVRSTATGIVVKVDAREYGPYEEVSGTPYFEEAGKSWGMIARRADGRFVALVNGAEKGPLSAAYQYCSDISVSADGSSWSLRAELGGSLQERMLRVVNGREYGPFQFTGDVIWSGAGAGRDATAPTAWCFRADAKGSQYILANDKRYGPYQDARDFAFDPTGTRLAFQFRGKTGVGIWVNGKEYGPFKDSRILRGPDGSFFGWTDTLSNGSQEITVGDRKYGPYSYIDYRLYVSPDQTRWLLMVVKNNASYLLSNAGEEQMERLEVILLKDGFLYHRNKGAAQYIVTDKGEFGPYENITSFTAIPDASSWGLGYWKPQDNSSWVVINGKEYPGENLKYRDGYFSWVSAAADGSTVYTRLDKGLATAVLFRTADAGSGVTITAGGKSLGPYERMLGSPQASADGKAWGLMASKGGGMTAVIINGAEAGVFGPYPFAEGFTMNEAGTVWSFSALKDEKATGPRFRVVNGVEYGPLDVDAPPTYAPDGSGWFFWTREAYLFFNGKRLGPYRTWMDDKVYDFSKEKLALRESTPQGTFVWVNDRKYGPYKDVEILRTGGERSMESVAGFFGFIATLKNGSQELYVDGDKTYGPFASVGQGRRWISADGKTWIMGARRQGADRDVLLMNGVETANNGWDLSPTSTGYLMMIRKNGREYLAASDRTCGPYERVQTWAVSSDGAVWAGEAMKTRGNSRESVIVVNGKEYSGERLVHMNTPASESFSWISYDRDGSGVMNTITVR